MKYGIRVKNPLDKPARVEIKSGNVVEKVGTVGPNETAYIPLDRAGTYEVQATALDDNGSGNYIELGALKWRQEDHQDVKPPAEDPKPKEADKPARSLAEMLQEMEREEVRS